MKTLFEAKMDGKPVTSVVHLTKPEEAEKLIGILVVIADEQEWQPGDQLRVYKSVAQHLAVIAGKRVVGGVQLVHNASSVKLPFQRVWPKVSIAGEATAHITILALQKEYRGHSNLFGLLCVELWRFCVSEGIQQIVIEATPSTLRLYRRLGWPLEIIGGLRIHWGEECFLCRMGVQDVAKALCNKGGGSASYRLMVEQAYRDL